MMPPAKKGKPDTDKIVLGYPRPLRQLAPASFSVGPFQKGPLPRVTVAGVHLRANTKYLLRVVPPQPEQDETVGIGKLEESEFVKRTNDHAVHLLPDGRPEHRIVFSVTPLRWPLPARSVISFPIEHSDLGTVSQSISIVVWPTAFNQLTWAFSAVVLPLAPFLTKEILVDEQGHHRNRAEIITQIQSMWLYILFLIAILVLAYPIGRILGWLYLFASSFFAD